MRRDWWIQGPYRYWFRDIAELIPEGRGVMVDVGCGAARQREMVLRKGYEWVGIDVERRAHPAVPVALIENGVFPVADGSADALLCRAVLQHVEDLDQFGEECRRVLKSSGFLYGSSSWLEPDCDVASFCNLSHRGIAAFLRRHGFELVTMEAGIHGLVLLLWTMLGAQWAGRFAHFAPRFQRRADQRERPSPQYAGMSREEFEKEQALRYAGHLLWVARKQ
jgi:SAM-dependent methyltransferase